MRFECTWLALLIVMTTAMSRAGEWPRWLGPHGDGVSTEAGLLDQWPANGPTKLWSVMVGQGFSSPVAQDGRVLMLGMQGNQDVLTALDAETGKVLWRQSNAVNRKADQPQAADQETGLPLPNATPTIDKDRIYTYGGGGDLICRDLKDGRQIWALNILDSVHSEILGWNQSSSPLVDDKNVYVQGGKGGPIAVALEKETGKIVWQSKAAGLGGYAAPILIDVGGVKQLIVLAGETLFAMNPADGTTIWEFPWKTDFDVNAATPIYHDHRLFITSAYGHGCAMLEVTRTGVKEAWHSTEVSCKFQPPILSGDRLYANSAGRLKCLQWPTQKVIWKNNAVKLREGGTMVLDGDKMITLSEDGILSLLQIKPDGATIVSEVRLFDFENVWATPMIYHGKLFAKGKDELVCLQIVGKK